MAQRVNGTFAPDYTDCTSYVISDVTQDEDVEVVYKSKNMPDLHVAIELDASGAKKKHRLTVWNSAQKPPAITAHLFAAEQKLAYNTIGKFMQANPQLVDVTTQKKKKEK